MKLNLKALKETKDFYKVELEKEDLTGGEKDSYLKALKIIEGFIGREEKEEAREKGKNIKYIAHNLIN